MRPSWFAAWARVRSIASPSSRVRSWSYRCSKVVDGLANLAVDLDIASVYGETTGVRPFVADAQDGGDTWARLSTVQRDD